MKEQVFVDAAKALGASNPRIIVRHILPNAASSIIVAATLRVASSIITESGLSFLGVWRPASHADMAQHAQERAGSDGHGPHHMR